MYSKLLASFLLLVIFSHFSCKRNKDNKPSWEIDVAAPILNSELSINEILASDFVTVNTDNSISLVYNNNLYALNVADQIISIPDTTFTNPFNINSVGLPLKSVINYTTLGRLAPNLPAPYNIIIPLSHGTNQIIPPVPNINTQYSDVDFSNFIKVAYNCNGIMEVHIHNELAVGLDSINFQFKNKLLGNVIDSMWLYNIPPGGIVARAKYLANDTIEGLLQAQVTTMKVVGSLGVPVLIDTTKGIEIKFVLRNFKADSAVAKFPNQYLVDSAQLVTYNELGGGAQIDLVRIKSGRIRIKGLSSIGEKMKFEFKIPSLISPTGQEAYASGTMPPGSLLNYSQFEGVEDLTGYMLDLRGPNLNMHNTFYDTIRIGIDSSGNYVSISKRDTLFAFYTLEDIEPDYARGYMGDTSFNVNITNAPFSLFNKIVGGNLNLDKVKVGLSINNGLGISATTTINSIAANNTRTGSMINLAITSGGIPIGTGAPISINSATDNFPTGSTDYLVPTMVIDETNSNIKPMIESFPNQFSFNASIKVNPNGNTSNYKDFVYWDNKLDVNMSFEMPLNFVANNLALIDTLNFSLGSVSKVDKIKDAIFTFYFDNGFPLDANIKVKMYNESWQLVDEFSNIPTILGGNLDANCKISNSKRTKYSFEVNQSRMAQLKTAKHAIITPIFNTSNSPTCAGQKVKIYSDYKFKTKLTAQFNYLVSF
jgi:hypothetical protein